MILQNYNFTIKLQKLLNTQMLNFTKLQFYNQTLKSSEQSDDDFTKLQFYNQTLKTFQSSD